MTNFFRRYTFLPLTEANLRAFNAINEPLGFTDADLLDLRPDFYPDPDDQLHSIPFTDADLLDFEDLDADSDANWSMVVGPGSTRTETEWEVGGHGYGEGEGEQGGQIETGRGQGTLASVGGVLQLMGRMFGAPVALSGGTVRRTW